MSKSSAAKPNKRAKPAVQLLDVTLRDGEQTQGVSFAQAEKVSVAKALLGALKVDRVEVASAGVSRGEQEAVTRITDWARAAGFADRVEVLGFIDGKRSVDWICAAGGRVLNLLAKGSEQHCREQLGKTPARHLQDIRRSVEYAAARGLRVHLYLEDWSNGYRRSPDYVYKLVEGLLELPIARYMLPDTLGVLGPREVRAGIADMRARFPRTEFDFHPHNDYGLGTANCLAAAEAGATAIHCTVNCLGERAGNASLAEVCAVLRDKFGAKLAVDETKIYTLSRMVENFSGKMVAANMPIVGADVFTQTAGIHADGDRKANLYQSVLSPRRFNRARSYALGKLSGRASLQKNLDALGISLSDSDRAKVLERVVKLGDSKDIITAEDLPFIIADILESKGERCLELLNCSVTSGLDLDSIVSVRVRLHGEIYKSTGAGNGGFDAFIMAMKKILRPRKFEFPELLDYQIRIPKGGASSSALVECITAWRDGDDEMRTRGVHANQVFAGVEAALRMLNRMLARAGAKPAARD